MEDAQMTLPIEEELVGYRLGAGQAGQRDGPGLPFADARGHPHAIGVLWQILGNGHGGALVKVQRVLSDPPQHLESPAALLEEGGEELRVASSVHVKCAWNSVPRRSASTAAVSSLCSA